MTYEEKEKRRADIYDLVYTDQIKTTKYLTYIV